MDVDVKKQLSKTANAIRQLSMEAVQKANSGHPGMPMGCAEIGAFLYGSFMQMNPKNPNWMNRDRLVLSAGHGSMWLYSCLYLSGFDVSLEDIQQFRQLHSKTPGHPEYHETPGVEVTTGPLGQGIGNAVGMALGMKMLGARFNQPGYQLISGKVLCLAGDGCFMEGISSEASSFAGHLNLDNLILIYDSNQICLDGPTSECFSEKTKARYESYGFDVYDIDGYDFEGMASIFQEIRSQQKKPVLVVLRTIIGKGSPHKAGTSKAHGSPLGEEEIEAAKEALGLSKEPFYVPQSVHEYFSQRLEKLESMEEKWNQLFQRFQQEYPELGKMLETMQSAPDIAALEVELGKLEIKSPIAGRSASQEVMQMLAKQLPGLIGGSADLSCSDLTMLKEYPIVTKEDFSGRNLKYGVREFAMGTITNALSVMGTFRPFCGTFFTFSDYLRNSIRLAALSSYPVIYQFTHDSVFLGEDGPTHQPVEQLASLRAMPNLWVIRPADATEVKMAWLAALSHQGPTAIVLSRQKLPALEATNLPFEEGMKKGAYLVKNTEEKPNFTLFATGSEVHLALEVADRLKGMGKQVRVISMPCWELFEKQPSTYRESLVGGDLGVRVSIEAASDLGWHRYIGREGITIAMESFGLSAPAADLAEQFGFTVDAIVERLMAHRG